MKRARSVRWSNDTSEGLSEGSDWGSGSYNHMIESANYYCFQAPGQLYIALYARRIKGKESRLGIACNADQSLTR